MGITEVVSAARLLWQNAYVERAIGSLRRECLDHIVIFNERHLRRVLSSYADYYHRTRHIFHSTRIAQTRAQSCHLGSEESSPFHKSMGCITVTNVSPPDSSRLLLHNIVARCRNAGA
jgi:transposase InsO family protein